MKKLAFALLLAAVFVNCKYVEPGYVGVKVYKLGGDKGVDHEVLGVGRYWIGMNEDLYTFPVFVQTVRWTEDKTDFNNADEAIRFNDQNGLGLKTDVGVSYTIRKEAVSNIFQRHRKGIEFISDVYLRNIVQDKFNRAASSMSFDDLNGPKDDDTESWFTIIVNYPD